MDKYYYEGPVIFFNKCIQDKWTGYTVAVSPKKAKSNLIFQWKKSHGLEPGSKIDLTGKLTVVD